RAFSLMAFMIASLIVALREPTARVLNAALACPHNMANPNAMIIRRRTRRSGVSQSSAMVRAGLSSFAGRRRMLGFIRSFVTRIPSIAIVVLVRFSQVVVVVVVEVPRGFDPAMSGCLAAAAPLVHALFFSRRRTFEVVVLDCLHMLGILLTGQVSCKGISAALVKLLLGGQVREFE